MCRAGSLMWLVYRRQGEGGEKGEERERKLER